MYRAKIHIFTTSTTTSTTSTASTTILHSKLKRPNSKLNFCIPNSNAAIPNSILEFQTQMLQFQTQLSLNLVEPQSSGIGGGGFLLYFDKKKSKLIFYDGREIAPSKIKKKFFLDNNNEPLGFFDIAIGGTAIGVPGLI